MVIDMRRSSGLCGAYRCIADGKDITNDAFYCDGRRRIVGVYNRNEQGRHFVDLSTMEISKRWLKPRRVRLVKTWLNTKQ